MFTTPEYAQRLLSANERIVRLTLQDSQETSLYVHPAFIKACSSVLGSLVEDVEVHPADTYCTIPLADTDVAGWITVLSMIHPSHEPFKINWDCAGSMLLRAHKYDMPCVTGHVVAFMEQQVACDTLSSSKQPAAAAHVHPQATYNPYAYASQQSSHSPGVPKHQTNLRAYLTKLTVGDILSCLAVFSHCGINKQAQECIDYALTHKARELIALPLTVKLLQGLQSEHADQLLAGLATCQLKQLPDKLSAGQGGTTVLINAL